jgi:hypothetical protein
MEKLLDALNMNSMKFYYKKSMQVHTLQFLLFFILFPVTVLTGQRVYKADASERMPGPVTGQFKMGNPGPADKAILVNSLYLTIGGKPVLPVMGEMHFSRIRRDRWEDYILKMKACGINIISTYLFWNHHEEIEGQFDWEGEKELRAFVQLCAKYNLYAIVRLGPWSHGEARNGGTPDWILKKKFIKDRSNDVVYQHYVTRYFSQIAGQLEGLCYKDGGPVIGIQLENEYWYAKEGEAYIQWLKDTALGLGIDVPLYTVTGWQNGSVPPFGVIPLWGAYADAPWAEHVEKVYQPGNFMFDSFRDDRNIGNEHPATDEYMSYKNYPYFTCEVGIGVQNTYHRRLVIDPLDGAGIMTAKLGSGSNLLGYYVFAGGTQFRGQLHSTEEEQEETGYWSRVPLKSYDFQAAIRESGEISEAYKEVKKLHYLVNEVGEKLAPMLPVLFSGSKNDLQLAIRHDDHSGFLFGINYTRFESKDLRQECRFQVKFKEETLVFPQHGIDIPDSALFIWPLNYDLHGLTLKYATAQLLGKVGNTCLFFQNAGIPVEMAFDPSEIENISADGAAVSSAKGLCIVQDVHPGRQCVISLSLKNGTALKIVILTEEEANNCWILDFKGKRECFISDAGMVADNRHIYLYSGKPEITLWRLTEDGRKLFAEQQVQAAVIKQPAITLRPRSLLADADWLVTADFKEIPAYQQRYHRFFFKEFSLENPSRFRKATLYIYPESDCQVSVNHTWVRQDIKEGILNAIDLTGYLVKGENILIVDFPYTTGFKRFAAEMTINYYNYDRVSITTDKSWLASDSYTNPSPLKPYERPGIAVVAPPPDFAGNINTSAFSEWELSVPHGAADSLQDLYIKLNYYGDRAELYNGYRLSADNFNNNQRWTIGLKGQEQTADGKNLRLVIYPLARDTKIYFDVPPGEKAYETTAVMNFEGIPEYKLILE